MSIMGELGLFSLPIYIAALIFILISVCVCVCVCACVCLLFPPCSTSMIL